MVTLPQWLEYIESQIGFILPSSQHRWLENAIHSTANSHDLKTDELWYIVHDDSALRQQLFDSLLIYESRFFRHLPSIDFITTQAKIWQAQLNDSKNIYQLFEADDRHIVVQGSSKIGKKKQTNGSDPNQFEVNRNFNIWSVGCSEGQEAWSIAMSLSNADVTGFHILGTDVSTKAIQSAEQAVYDAKYKLDVPSVYHEFLHDRPDSSKWQVDDKLRQSVSFTLHNIFLPMNRGHTSPTSYLSNKQKVIICQNMLIYFRRFDQRDILARFVEHCELGGHIILAPGEAVFWHHPQMEKVVNEQINAWKKVR